MVNPAGKGALDASHLRERNIPQQARNDREAREAVLHLNAEEEKGEKKEKDKKTYGRTPNGIVFTVPFTQDMVTQLLSPSEPKNMSDLAVLLILALHILALWKLPRSWRIPFFAIVFIFWRASYNLGIGCLLQLQSHSRRLVRWASKWQLFVNPQTGKNPHPRLYAIMKWELETKIRTDYSFEQAPIEYNTWLIFRRVVDLILMCDFVSYCLFAMACGGTPPGEAVWATTARWVVGISLVAFNLWVKLDAHRVVKDYAWYWGDFFYLIDQELTFDGVFEMAPHPMYSVGYAGYYGISLMAASYKVLFISIAAHAAQFIFLVWVENPHIQRTYNSPSPRKRSQKATKDGPVGSDGGPSLLKDGYPSSVHNLMGWSNIDLYRTSDSSIFVAQILMIALTLLTPSTPFHLALFVTNAALWRLWFSIGIGYLLNRQSEKKQWTRHFLKYGESVEEAWRQWKGTYHLSMTMCYASFIAAAWKAYVLPDDWNTGFVLLKHIIGCGLLLLQSWVSVSIYESLGEFGWFYGDFFFDQSPKLTYDGIYRFLNNPERVLGLAGIWGVALITESFPIFCLALFSHVVSLAFVQFVERPHMQKLYGRELRQDAGLVRSLKRSLPPPLRQWQDGMDRVLTETFDSVEEFLGAARPQLAARASNFVKDTKRLYNKYPTTMSITLSEQDMAGLNPKDYSITIEHPDKSGRNLFFEYGSPITIHWTAPLNHSPWDWIGLYRTSDNTSREVTRLPSFGRWVATNPGVYDSPSADSGQIPATTNPKTSPTHTHGSMTFSHSKLFWTCSVFEFRYHHAGKHQVLAVSPPLSIRITPFSEPANNTLYNQPSQPQLELSLRRAVEEALLPLVQDCFDRDPEIAPDAADDTYGGLVQRDGRFAKRVVYAVQRKFGVEFAPEVVRADGTVRNLAWRVWNAKRVLEPYSTSHPLHKRVKKFKRATSEP